MGEQATWITQFVNHYLGSAALALLSALHIRPNNPELPVPEHVVMGLLVLLALPGRRPAVRQVCLLVSSYPEWAALRAMASSSLTQAAWSDGAGWDRYWSSEAVTRRPPPHSPWRPTCRWSPAPPPGARPRPAP